MLNRKDNRENSYIEDWRESTRLLIENTNNKKVRVAKPTLLQDINNSAIACIISNKLLINNKIYFWLNVL